MCNYISAGGGRGGGYDVVATDNASGIVHATYASSSSTAPQENAALAATSESNAVTYATPLDDDDVVDGADKYRKGANGRTSIGCIFLFFSFLIEAIRFFVSLNWHQHQRSTSNRPSSALFCGTDSSKRS